MRKIPQKLVQLEFDVMFNIALVKLAIEQPRKSFLPTTITITAGDARRYIAACALVCPYDPSLAVDCVLHCCADPGALPLMRLLASDGQLICVAVPEGADILAGRVGLSSPAKQSPLSAFSSEASSMTLTTPTSSAAAHLG